MKLKNIINKNNYILWLICILLIIILSQLFRHIFFNHKTLQEGMDTSSSNDLKSKIKQIEDKLKVSDNRDALKSGANLGVIYFKNKLVDDSMELLKKDKILNEDMSLIELDSKMIDYYSNMSKILDELPVAESSK